MVHFYGLDSIIILFIFYFSQLYYVESLQKSREVERRVR